MNEIVQDWLSSNLKFWSKVSMSFESNPVTSQTIVDTYFFDTSSLKGMDILALQRHSLKQEQQPKKYK